jgi:hypothetical protein
MLNAGVNITKSAHLYLSLRLILRNFLLFISLINIKFWVADVYICSIQIYGKLLEYVLSVRNDALHGPEKVELIIIKSGEDT